LDYTNAPRSTIPAWAQRIFGVSADQAGPDVSSNNPFGTYMEDNAYLGDLTNSATGTNYQQGVDFDLDEYNGRWCVTPDFPNGTYAYFVAIDSNGMPVYPYDIGRAFYGDPTGGSVSSISETVVTNFLGGTNLISTLNPPTVDDGTVTLTWSAVEGGNYQVEATTNLSDSSGWTVLAGGISPVQTAGSYTNATSNEQEFYRVGRTSVSNFDSAGTTIFTVASYAPGGSANRGQIVVMTITLPSSPPWPPADAPISNVMMTNSVSSFTSSTNSDSTQGTVVSTFTLTDVPAGTQTENVVVTFQGGPPQPYVLTNGFTIY